MVGSATFEEGGDGLLDVVFVVLQNENYLFIAGALHRLANL